LSKDIKKKQSEIFKLGTSKLVNAPACKLVEYTKEQSKLQGETVKVMDNLVFKKIRDYYAEVPCGKIKVPDMSEELVNVIIPMERSGEKEYDKIANNGFSINGNEYERFVSGSGQIRRNTVSFIKREIKDYVFNALMCGLELKDFGDNFNPAKFNAYFGLNMSGCNLLQDFPNVCIIDDYEQIKPDLKVNYIREENIQYILTKEGDYIIRKVKYDESGTPEYYDVSEKFTYDNENNIATRMSDGADFKIFSEKNKYPEVVSYKDIESADCLNSFDGQGLCDPSWAEKVAVELGYCQIDHEGNIVSGYLPSQFILRAPWVKGMVATFPIREYLVERGINTVIDSMGKERVVKDIDIFISKSQWKMMKIYVKKCSESVTNENGQAGIMNAWDYHQMCMKKNGLQWGIVMPNKMKDDDVKTLNYQYESAMMLNTDDDIDELCSMTEDKLKNLCPNRIDEIVDTLMQIGNSDNEESCSDEELEIENGSGNEYKRLWEKVVAHNYDLLHDKYIQEQISKDCKSKFKAAKIGKLLSYGNFQFIVSDPVAQMEWIVKNHTIGHEEQQVCGVLLAKQVYSDYWLQKSKGKESEELILMRSPLIDRHEITKMNLVMAENKYFRYLKSGIVLSIFDLATLQMQNCDFDGDRCFSSNMDILKHGCMDVCYPLYYENSAKSLEDIISKETMVEADKKGINSKVGQISNKSASFYAMLPLYDSESKEYASILNSITVMGEVVGVEIDKIKTGIPPQEPYNWKPAQVTYRQVKDGNDEYGKPKFSDECNLSDEEKIGANLHNILVPDRKPYYFRYVYEWLSKDIDKLETELNKESLYNHGLKLSDLVKTSNFEDMNNEVQKWFSEKEKSEEDGKEFEFSKEQIKTLGIWSTLKRYKIAYPVLDTNCIMNRICHKFEKMEKEFKVVCDGKNMLGNYTTEQVFDSEILRQVEKYIFLYKKHKTFMTKNNNQKRESNKQMAKETKERLDSLRDHVMNQIETLFDNTDAQTVFDYMVKAVKDKDIKYVWEIMDEKILLVIPQKLYKGRMAN